MKIIEFKYLLKIIFNVMLNIKNTGLHLGPNCGTKLNDDCKKKKVLPLHHQVIQDCLKSALTHFVDKEKVLLILPRKITFLTNTQKNPHNYCTLQPGDNLLFK